MSGDGATGKAPAVARVAVVASPWYCRLMGTVARPAPEGGALIALDWGTTMLRAFLVDAAGVVSAERAEPWGIMQVAHRDFAGACRDITIQWSTATELPIIASGMIGSANGWMDAPYRPTPAGAEELASALVQVAGTKLHIIPGVSQQHGSVDVMRGEETQAIGALSLVPSLGDGALLVFPGTHSKWVRIRDHRIVSFSTYMTGELYGVLRTHSILGRLADGTTHVLSTDEGDAAFALGVTTARDSTRGTEALLFSARARVLLGNLRAAASLDYLSGLIIGGELRDALGDAMAPDALVGDAALCARYMAALALFGIPDVPRIDRAAPTGMWQIAHAAGLIARPAAFTEPIA